MNPRWRPRGAALLSRLGLVAALLFLTLRPSLAQITIQPVASGLSSPVALANAGDGSGRLFIVEQGGTIRVWNGTSVLGTPFLDVSALVSTGSERGLLGLAFHPGYASNGRFFIFYTATAGALTIAEYHATPASNVADAGQVQLIRSIPHPNTNHNGGMLAFGPDGFLYASTGDGGGNAGDPEGDAQSLASLFGKILRFDVDGPSLIPALNPFVDGNPATRDEIWAYGLRNPWRFSFDRQNGDLYIGDVGENCWEEIDRQPAGDPGGTNYGWNVVEGNECYDPPSCNPSAGCGASNYESPIAVTGHDPDCAVTGGYRYRGSASPGLAGTYFFGDYCSGIIRGATQGAGGTWTKTNLLDTDLGISSFGEDEQGELYLTDVFGGGVYRITGTSPPSPFSDDFEDGDASDWTVDSGSWSVVAGALTNLPTRKARVLAPAAPCDLCSIATTVTALTPGADLVLIGWWKNSANHVEVILSEDRDKVILRRIASGEVSSQKSAAFVFGTNQPVTVEVVYDGTQLSVYLNGSGTPIVSLHARRLKPGIAGFAVKGTRRIPASGAMDEIEIE